MRAAWWGVALWLAVLGTRGVDDILAVGGLYPFVYLAGLFGLSVAVAEGLGWLLRRRG